MTRAGRESGFSFVELVVVITLIAVLVSFSIPLFRDARFFPESLKMPRALLFSSGL